MKQTTSTTTYPISARKSLRRRSSRCSPTVMRKSSGSKSWRVFNFFLPFWGGEGYVCGSGVALLIRPHCMDRQAGLPASAGRGARGVGKWGSREVGEWGSGHEEGAGPQLPAPFEGGTDSGEWLR